VPGEVALQLASGVLRVHRPDGAVDLDSGRLLVLDRDTPFSMQAIAHSTVVLTVARHVLPSLRLDMGAEWLGNA
jgi:hypothetical protein